MRSLLSRNGYVSIKKQFIRTVADSSATVTASEHLKPWQEIPGPPSLPIVGQLLNFLPGGKFSDQNTALEKMYKEYGHIIRLDSLLGRSAHILVFDPESCEHVLRSENVMPSRPGFPSLTYYRTNKNRTKEELAKPMGLLIDEKENWKQFRSTVNPVMLQPKTIKLYKTSIEKVAEEMIERMKTNRDEKQMLRGNFEIEVNLWSLESIGVIALGRRLNCFDPNLPKNSPERKLIECVHDFFTISNELDFQPSLWRYYPTKTYKKAMKVYEDLENVTKYFIRKTMDTLKNDNVKPDEEKSILQKLLEKDENTAVIMACDMLFAGVDTTATTVTGILYHLATNPEKQSKLREELTSNESRMYLRACVKESLRISPVVAGNMRKTSKEYNLLGYRIPKDMLVAFGHELMCQEESQFPRPKEFIPERWIEKHSPLYYKQAHPFSYSPFGFGVRSCIGRRIAELEIETFIEKVIQNFQVEWTGPPPAVKRSALNYFTGPFNFIFKDL